jgi:hypothetical protein
LNLPCEEQDSAAEKCADIGRQAKNKVNYNFNDESILFLS